MKSLNTVLKIVKSAQYFRKLFDDEYLAMVLAIKYIVVYSLPFEF